MAQRKGKRKREREKKQPYGLEYIALNTVTTIRTRLRSFDTTFVWLTHLPLNLPSPLRPTLASLCCLPFSCSKSFSKQHFYLNSDEILNFWRFCVWICDSIEQKMRVCCLCWKKNPNVFSQHLKIGSPIKFVHNLYSWQQIVQFQVELNEIHWVWSLKPQRKCRLLLLISFFLWYILWFCH